MIKSIDYGGFSSYGPLGYPDPVCSVYMAMNKVFWLVFVQKPDKALETPMREGIKVVDVPSRSMGKENVKTFIPP